MQNTLSIDWLTYTVKEYSAKDVAEMLCIPMCKFEQGRGLFGYKKCYEYDDIKICYDTNRPEIMCYMTGNGCRIYENFGGGDWSSLFYLLGDIGANITRLDLAYDDYNGVLNLKQIDEDIKYQNFNAKVKTIRVNEDVIGNSGAYTAYIGSRQSLCMHRIYNKAVEQGVTDRIPHWVRWELEIKQEKATEVIQLYNQGYTLNHIFMGVIKDTIQFNSKWYDEFINDAEKCILHAKKKPKTSVESIYNYLNKQCGRAIEVYINLFGIEGLQQLIKDLTTKKAKRYTDTENLYRKIRFDEMFENQDYFTEMLMGAVDIGTGD